MIKLESIHKRYSLGEIEVPVLFGINLHVPRGKFLAIMGPSGSGKSTLLNIVGCLDVPDEGRYSFAGRQLTATSEDDLNWLRNQEFGFVFQSFNLLPRMTALQNVELPMVYARVDGGRRRARAAEVLHSVGLADRMHHTPAQLSGGQKQRVAIARALVNDPSVLIADEPTGSLDSASSREIMDIFAGLHRDGTTIVMVTHEEEIADYAERVLVMRDGHIDSDRERHK